MSNIYSLDLYQQSNNYKYLCNANFIRKITNSATAHQIDRALNIVRLYFEMSFMTVLRSMLTHERQTSPPIYTLGIKHFQI